MEAAAGGRLVRVRRLAVDEATLGPPAGGGAWHGVEQHPCEGVLRICDQLVGGRGLDDLSEVHHGDGVAEIAHDRDVVADEQHRHAERRPKFADHVEDRALDRHIERRGDLIGDQQLRFGGERTGDRHPLQLSAGQLPRQRRDDRRVERDEVEEPVDLVSTLGAAEPAANGERLRQRLLDRHARIERGVRILEHHLHEPPPLPGCPSGSTDVRTVERDRPVGEWGEADDRLGQRRLAGTGLADEPEHTAGGDVEVDSVDGRDRVPSGPVANRDVADRQHAQRCTAVWPASSLSPTSGCQQAARQPSPSCSSSGRSARHRSSAWGQRAAKAQPGSTRRGSGGRPGIDAKGASRSSVHVGNGADERPRVRVRRAVEGCGDIGLLDDPPGVHHHHACAELGDRGDVVRDEQHRGSLRLVDTAQQVEDLPLHGDVERGRRLVGDVQLRLAHQPHGDHRPLLHAAGQLVRIGAQPPVAGRRWRRAAASRRLALVASARLNPPCTSDDLGELSADPRRRVQRRARVLEHHRQRRGQQPAPLARRQVADVAAVEAQPLERHLARKRDELGDRQRGHRLAGARLADDADELASTDGEGDVPSRVDVTARRRECHREARHIEDEVLDLIGGGRDRDRHAAATTLHHRDGGVDAAARHLGEPVAEEVERQPGEDDRHSRGERCGGADVDPFQALAEHPPPVVLRRLQPEAEERQRREGEERRSDRGR